jgi:hypothetical protein
MKKRLVRLVGFIVLISMCLVGYGQKETYELRVYKLKSTDQVNETDNYLKDAFLPAMHRLGIKQIGVFKPVSNDTSEIKQIIVLIPYISVDVWRKTKLNIEIDPVYTAAAKGFIDADTNHYPFVRMESTLMEAFPDQPKLIPTNLKSHPEAIYELRNYESPTEELHRVKVDMFNAGGEIALFKRLDFQAVFMQMSCPETVCLTWFIWLYLRTLPRGRNIGNLLETAGNGKRFLLIRNTEIIFQ